jgi:hypothetical protein
LFRCSSSAALEGARSGLLSLRRGDPSPRTPWVVPSSLVRYARRRREHRRSLDVLVVDL